MNSLLRPVLLLSTLVVGSAALAQDADFDPASAQPQDPVADAIGNAPNEGNQTKTRAELCTSACNRDYEICNDEGSAGRDSLNDRPSATQLDSIRCQDDLKKCLKGCRGL